MKYNTGDDVFQQLVFKDLSARMHEVQCQRRCFSKAFQQGFERPVARSTGAVKAFFNSLLTFLVPILFRIHLDTRAQVVGLFLYIIGLLVYFASWMLQMSPRAGALKTKPAVRAAPAYTAMIWLLGIGLIGRYSVIPSFNTQTAYFFIIFAFSIVHTYHALFVCKKTTG